MIKAVDKKDQTPLEQAQAEVEAEARKENVARFKQLLEQKAKAEKTLRNLDREIEDLEAELAE